jgi:hypothetical protein
MIDQVSKAKWFALLTAALLLVGCSAARLAYNNATSLASWYLSDYVDFNEEQSAALRTRLDTFFAWHRKTELPEILRLLKDTSSTMDRDLTTDEIANTYKAVRARYEAAAKKALPDTVAMLNSLSEEQVTQIDRRFSKDNAKRAKTLTKSAAERTQTRGERMQKEAKEWCGTLTNEQQQILTDFNKSLTDIDSALDLDSKYRQQEFLRLVRANRQPNVTVALTASESPSHVAMEKGLRRIMFDQASWRKPELQAELKTRERLTAEMIVQFYKTMTPAQRAKAKQRITGYMADVTTLIASS